jgi:hypothetical protein
MAVQPTQPDRIGGSNLGRARRTPEAATGQARVDRDGRRPVSTGDSIEISPAAEELHQVSANYEVGDSDLSPERLQQVLNRISQGFYLRPEVRAEVARRLANVIRET